MRESDRQMMGDSPSLATAYPFLADWVGGRPDHPLPLDELDAAYAAELDELFGTVSKAAPTRWEGRRRDFRSVNDDRELRSAYLEIVVAATLVKSGVPMEFRDRPDIVAGSKLGLEVTSRHVETADLLSDDLAALEHHLTRIAIEKRHQAVDVPTLLVVDVATAGIAWLRPPEVWAHRLGGIVNAVEAFVGLVVTNVSYGNPFIDNSAVAIRVGAELPSVWEEVASAFGWVPV